MLGARRVRRSHLGFALLAWLGACGDDGGLQGVSACGEAGCAPGCEELQTECDILDAECRERVMEAVVCVRGTPGQLPEVEVIGEEEYLAELEAGYRGDGGVAGDAGMGMGMGMGMDAGMGMGAYASWDRALRLVGLLAEDVSSEEALVAGGSSIAAYYSSRERAITLVDRGGARDTPWARRLLAHELVHALQDQQFGIPELYARGGAGDASRALRCLLEGEAEHYGELALSLLEGFSPDPRFTTIDLQERLKYARDELASDRNAYYGVSSLVYEVGHAFIAEAWHAEGNAGVQRVIAAPPTTTMQWMRGYGALRSAELAPIRPLPCNDAMPPDGYEVHSATTLGALQVFAVLTRLLVEDGLRANEAAWRHAQAWTDDSFTVFEGDAGAVAVSWRMRFEDEAVAEAIARAIDRRAGDGWRSIAQRVDGERLELLASTDPAVLEAWAGTDPEACPE